MHPGSRLAGRDDTHNLMDQDIAAKFEVQSEKLDAIHESVEKMRKYFLWTLIISVLFIVLPLLGLAFVIPQFLSTLTAGL